MLSAFLFAIGVAALAIEPSSYPTTTTSETYPNETTTDGCTFLCIDYINECGQMYGGCFNDCPGVPRPTYTPPPCPSTTPSPDCSATTTSSACSTTTAPPECPRTICVDYINECGQWYGGCYDDCGPKPTFTDPGCPTTNTSCS